MVITRSRAKLEATSTSITTTTTTTTTTTIDNPSSPNAHPILHRPRPYPDKSPKTIKKSTKKTSKTSLHFPLLPSVPVSPHIFRTPPPNTPYFGLVQESLTHSLYFLCIQAILWNLTRGQQARPVLGQILTLYPTPENLALADLKTLTGLLSPIGLHNIRAARLIAFAKAWIERPPSKHRRYRKVDYPTKSDGRDVGKTEVLEQADEREGWEIAHLSGIGAYALDSFRIFYRDQLRGLEGEVEGEEEWRMVLPLDKDLRAYLVWRWAREGWKWDMLTGKRNKITAEAEDQIVESEMEPRT